MSKHITTDKLNHRGLYKLEGSNIKYGVWDSTRRSFIGIVRKNGFKTLETIQASDETNKVYAVKNLHVKAPKTIKLKQALVKCKKHDINVVYATYMSVGDLGWIHEDIEAAQCSEVKTVLNKKLIKFIEKGIKESKLGKVYA